MILKPVTDDCPFSVPNVLDFILSGFYLILEYFVDFLSLFPQFKKGYAKILCEQHINVSSSNDEPKFTAILQNEM